MVYDEDLVLRIRKVLAGRPGMTEKTMFGGVAFLLNGHMFCGIVKDELMVRIGKAGYAEALRKPHVRPMDFTGKPLAGYVYVDQAGCRGDAALAAWLERGAEFVRTLPAKTPKTNGSAPRRSSQAGPSAKNATRRR